MNNRGEIRKKLQEADAVLIGASNGLSITEGLHLFADNQAFEDLFGDLKQKYGMQCILQGMGARWPSEEEKWGFWSRLVHHYCGEYRESRVMADLKKLIGKKDYFVITSNGECQEVDGNFIPETESRKRLEAFLAQYHGKKLAILELGIGWRNQRIKAPLMRLAAREPQAVYVTVNLGEIFIPDEIRDKSYGLDGDLAEVLHELAEGDGETNNYEKWCEQWREKFLKMDQGELKKRLPELKEGGEWLTLCHFGRKLGVHKENGKIIAWEDTEPLTCYERLNVYTLFGYVSPQAHYKDDWVRFLFWEGDDEFPAQGNVLFDASATDFIHGESIVTIAAIGLNRIAKWAGIPMDRSAFPIF